MGSHDMRFLVYFRLLLVALWLGAAVYFIGVAQSAFAVLPERELAGAVVNRTLSILNIGGLVIGIIALLLSFIGGGSKLLAWGERIMLAVVVIACAVGQFIFGMWLAALRLQMGGPIDAVAIDDPVRVAFNSIHQYSEWTLMAAMAAALIAFMLIAARDPKPDEKKTADVYDFTREFKV